MFRKRKILGSTLAVLCLIACSAVVASAASAASFQSAAYPATASGEQTTKFELTTKAGTIKCSTASFTGVSLSEATATLKLTPAYGGCTIAGIGATYNMNGCSYVLGIDSGSGSEFNGYMDLTCPEGKEATISVVGSECQIHLHKITERRKTTYRVLFGLIEWSNESSVTKWVYTITAGNKCPNKPASGKYEDGTLKGVASLAGSNGALSIK